MLSQYCVRWAQSLESIILSSYVILCRLNYYYNAHERNILYFLRHIFHPHIQNFCINVCQGSLCLHISHYFHTMLDKCDWLKQSCSVWGYPPRFGCIKILTVDAVFFACFSIWIILGLHEFLDRFPLYCLVLYFL